MFQSSLIGSRVYSALALFCFAAWTGCTGGAAGQPAAASSTGTVNNSKSPATTPSASQVDPPATVVAADAKPVKKPKPVIWSASELAKVIDFTKFPQIKGTKAGHEGAANFNASVPGKVKEVAAFYSDNFAKLGWERSAALGNDPATDDAAFGAFVKDGHTVQFSIFRGGEKGESTVSLMSHGNFDTGTLSRPADARQVSASPTFTLYFTKNKVPDEADRILKALAVDGWQPYERLYSSKAEATDQQRFLLLRKRAYMLNVMIATAPAEHGDTNVQYSVEALSHELPTPPEATDVEFDDQRWELHCNVPGDFKPAAEFYRKAMPDLGFKALSSEDPQSTYWNLRFGTDGGDIVLVQAASKDHKTTKILITGISAAVLAEMKKHEGE